jgi:predicted metal-dependent peptidase
VDDLIMTPGKIGTEAWVAFAGDVSGSMTDEGRQTLIGFIESTAREFPDVRVFLVTHTDRVEWKGWMKAGGDLGAAKAATGFSGGTDFKPAYDAVREAGKKFDALVHFTDGYNAGEWPECPARQLIVGLWGSGHGMTTPPAGAQVVPVASVEGDM